jgi:ABC-type Fe3+/spermidine/putrescine transport system ATPase subunit
MALADRIGVMRDGQIEQVGTPQVLYEKPATPFIASFVGGATLVHGTYDSTGKTFRNGTFVFHDESAQTACASGPVTLAVRPDAVRISGAGQSQMEGTLLSIEYRGYIVAFRVQIGDIELSCVASGSYHLPKPGSRISFDLDPGACTLFGTEVR